MLISACSGNIIAIFLEKTSTKSKYSVAMVKEALSMIKKVI